MPNQIKELLANLKNLSQVEKDLIKDEVLKEFTKITKTSNSNDFLSKNKQLYCNICYSKNIIKFGVQRNGNQRYFCRNCRKTFSISKQTTIYKSHNFLDTWLDFLRFMDLRISLRKKAEQIGIALPTAFYYRHKVMYAVKNIIENIKIDGDFYFDETYVKKSYKGKNEHYGVIEEKRGISDNLVSIFVAINDKNICICRRVGYGHVDTETLVNELKPYIVHKSTAIADKNKSYWNLGEKLNIKITLYDSKIEKEKLKPINIFCSELKSYLKPLKGVATKYLQDYLNWFCILKMVKTEALAIRLTEYLKFFIFSNDVLTYKDMKERADIITLEFK
jgi:transposase-like protein